MSSGEWGEPLGGADQGLFPQPHRSLGGRGGGGWLLLPGSQGEAAQATSNLPQEGLGAQPSHVAPGPVRALGTPTPSLDWGPTPPGRKDSTLLGPITWLLFCLWVAQPGCGPECDTQESPEGLSRLPGV